MLSTAVYLLAVFTTILCMTQADAPSKGDRGDAVTSGSLSSTSTRDLIKEATAWERPVRDYGRMNFYPASGNSKGYSQTRGSNNGYQGQAQGNQKGYPTYTTNTGYGGYGNQGVYGPQNRGGGYVATQPGYGTNKGWAATNTGWGGNYGRPSYGGGNYKGSPAVNQGWYGGQSGYGGQTGYGGQPSYGGGWYEANQVRPASGGYNWPPSSGYRGEKGYSGSYGGNWGYGNQGSGYGGGYVSQGTNKGLGNQIYGSGYSGAYGGAYGGANQKGWSNPGYQNTSPVQGGWGYNTWDNYGYQGYNKGGSSPRINAAESNVWSNTRSGYINPNNKGWW